MKKLMESTYRKSRVRVADCRFADEGSCLSLSPH